MGRSKDNDRLVLHTKFGKLVCEVMRDDADYKEFAIDLYRKDGKAVQILVVGTDEYTDDPCTSSNKVHTYIYDGEDADVAADFYTEPFGDGWWTDEPVE